MAWGTCVIFTCFVLSLTIGLSTRSVLAQCDGPLGFENGNITDDQLSATSVYGTYTADQARLNVGRGWSGGSSSDSYLAVDLLSQHEVTRYSIQGSKFGWYSRTVALFYSQDRLVWERYISRDGRDTLQGNTNYNTVRSFDLNPTVKARYLAFQPISRSGYPSLRLELYGCEVDQPVPVRHTEVKNDIEDTREWLPSQSPYVLNSMINIRPSGHVKVQPGVKIVFNSSAAGLVVLGTLETNGLSGLPVVFSPTSPGISVYKGWKGIEVLGQGNLTLEHCDIHGAVSGIKGPLSSITVRHCNIHHNEIGVDLSMGDTDPGRTQFIGTWIMDNKNRGIFGSNWERGQNAIGLRNCEIKRNREYNFYVDREAVITAENSEFSYSDYGIYHYYYGIDLTLKNCNFTDTNQAGLYLNYIRVMKTFNISIDGSQFKNNKKDGIRLNVQSVPKGSNFAIKNSNFTDNGNEAIEFYGAYFQNDYSVFIQNNTFVALTTTSWYLVYFKGYGTNSNTNCIIESNSFFTRQAIWLVGERLVSYEIAKNTFIKLTGNQGIRIQGGNVSIVDNIFSNCTTSPVINTQALNTSLSRNSFLNPEVTFDVLVDLAFMEGVRLNASHNYWGSNNKFNVRSRICDFFCDLNKVIVDVHPFYTSESLTELSTEMDSDLFSFQSADTIGGILTHSVMLDPHQILFVNRSLYIPDEYKMTVPENVTLVFQYKQGIFVKGMLEIQGKQGAEVVLTNIRTDKLNWGGLIFNSTGSSIKHMQMRKTQTGLQLNMNNTGTFIISDSIITQSNTALSGLLWADVSVALHRVKVNETSKTLNIKKMSTNTVIVEFFQSDISGDTYLQSDVQNGHFNVSISSTKFSGGRSFSIQSCRNNITLTVTDSVFTSDSSHTIDVDGGPLNVLMRNISATGYGGLTSFRVCSLTNVDPGTIDIQDSVFSNTGYSYAWNMEAGYGVNSPHTMLLLNNTFHTTKNYAGLYVNNRGYSYPWSIVASRNIFTNAGIDLHGGISGASFDENTFQGTSTVFRSNINTVNVAPVTTLARNVVQGGVLTLYSRRVDAAFVVVENVFNASSVILKNPNNTMHENIFLNGSEFDIKFEGNGHADKEINCTFNYWGTTEMKLIDRRLYDSSYDEKLPTIIFVPFYGFQNLTDPLYPEESFLSSDGTIGGKVGGSVTLTQSGSPYIVTANIEVDRLETLIIEAGVKLLFLKGLGIFVDGTFKVHGNSTHPVEAKSMVLGQKWLGVVLRGHIYRPSSDSLDIRLVGGKDEREGRVEVKRNGTWGTVCDDRFDSRDASVVCRMLGYDPSATNNALYGAKFGIGSGPIWFGNLGCNRFEETLDQCKQTRFSCSHNEDVGVRCNGIVLPTSEEIENEVMLHYFQINDTEKGMEMNGNITSAKGIASRYSNTDGFTIRVGFKGLSTLNMEGMVASHNKKSGVYFTSSQNIADDNGYLQMTTSDCDIQSNGEHGIHIRYDVNISIVNCQFVQNKDRAIYLYNKAIIDISQSVFTKNRGAFGTSNYYYRKIFKLSLRDSRVINHDMRSYRSSRWYFYNSLFEIYSKAVTEGVFTFVNNVFSGNIGNLFHFDLNENANQSVNIENNTFKDNNASISLLYPPYRAGILYYFVNNTVENNTVPDFLDPLLKIIHRPNSNGSHVKIARNTFLKNTAPQIVNLLNIRKLETNMSITRNIFKSNNCSETVKTTVFGFTLLENVFNNHLSRCELEAPEFERWYDIDARWNYWGSQNTETVFSKICGFDSQMDRSFVHYLPFYLTEELKSVATDVQTDFWISNLHGGVIDRLLRLEKKLSPFHIKRSIFIRGNGALEIERGVELRFQPNTGIYNDGVLVTDTSSERVTLTRALNASWFGVVFPYKTAEVSKTVRLVNGSKANEGRVEVFINGSWSTVCNMDKTDARLVCQALGYGSKETIIQRFNFEWGQGKSILSDLGCDESMTSLTDCHPTMMNNRFCDHRDDYWLTCNEFVAHTGKHKFSYLEHVSLLGSKIGVIIQTPTVRLSNCHINNTKTAGLTLDSDAIELDLNGTVVEHGDSDGIFVKVSKNLTLLNGTTQNNMGNGITLFNVANQVVIEKMNIINNRENGLETSNAYNSKNTNIVVKHNVFKDHVINGFGLKLNGRFYASFDNFVTVENNDFINNVAGSMDMPLASSTYYSKKRMVFIRGNKFYSSGLVSVYVPYYISVTIENNIATNCTGGMECFFSVNVNNNDNKLAHNITFSTNTFEETHGKCVVYLKSTDYNFNGTFNYNQIYSSSTKHAAIILDSSKFTFFYNIFDNPSTNYELKVEKTGPEEVKAKNNWWGSTDPMTAGSRILHKEQDQRLLRVDYMPILTDQKFDCSAVMNCSGKGECVRPNGCRCKSGWAGSDCSDFDCSGVGNCNGNGDCTGPNQCECTPGWKGSSCVLATCHEVEDCSGYERGYCVLPNRCTCFPQYSGVDCSQCAALRWGPSCLPCPRCIHGACNITNGHCECDSANWSGELCDTCSDTFYGPNCLPYINILNIIPSSGPDTGDTKVHIWGHNFPQTENNTFFCRFDRTVVNGTRLSREHVVCKTPQHPKGDVIVEISSNGQHFTRNQTKFTYYEVCPPGACGKTMTPAHGHCLYGGCVCTLPWSGNDCNIELKAPIVSLESETQLVAEGEEYRLQPTITQGSAPINWLLIGAPIGMRIGARTGLIYWERTVASGEPYIITVKATNRVGHTQVVLSLTVPLSYNVTIDELLPSGQLPVPKSVLIKGHVSFHSETSRSLIAFVDVKIRNKGTITSSISVVTSPNTQDRFETVYFPKAGDSGLFEVDGRHPSDSGFTAQRSWRVLGMKCVPGYTSRQAYLNTEVVVAVVEMRTVTVLKNDGVDQVKNITTIVEGVGGPLSSVVVRVNNVLSSDVSRPLIETLDPGTELTVDLILAASKPLRGTIGVVFSTAEGTMARVRVGLQLKKRRPVLIPSTRLLTATIPRATQKTFQVNITNVGEVPATGLRVTFPSEPRLANTAFSNSRGQTSEDGLDLQPDETAILVLTVTARSDDALGEFSGSIALNSNLSSTAISYRFYVTSLEKLNITVRVEDEFTYFASDKPLVSGAIVTLKSQLRGYNEQRITTNETEFVSFEDVHEDRYTLQATAPGHSSYSAVIIAKPSDSSFSIFLQRVAVTYTWTVTPTTFEDKYIITLDSTFETQVPMPVVTVEPANINIIPYEEGKKKVVNFNITNHGLIRADNARFLIPRDHPSLIFTQTIDPIGAVEANTSIIVPVLVRVKSRVKRNAAAIACGLKMLYDYFCGQTRTGGQDITLSRQYPGRPPLPCGGGGRGGVWSGSGSGRGGGGYVGITGTGSGSSRPSSSVVVYNPVTPLSCDCAGSLIKDCILGFHPLAGCALATVGLSGNTGFVDNALAGLSFGFACILTPLSAVCPLCGLAATLWQAGSCIAGVNSNCNSKRRRRRAANSEVIQGMINSNVPMQNYLIMMKEIYGGEDMFDVYDNSWMNSFNLALAEDSVAGQFLSQSEITSIVAPLNKTLVPTVQKFLLRWNKTITAWEDGTLATLGPDDDVISYNIIMTRSEQFRKDNANAKKRGFDSIFSDFDNTVNVYKEKEKKGKSDEGVCAKVRVRIVQELVLTRDAFNARLEIENGEQSALKNIAVSVNIRPTYGDGKYTTDKFSIGNPALVGITAVDGTGTLERDKSGTAEWLIIPYSTAAVKEDTLYDVGGTLSYTVDDSNFSIPLLPDTITVKPNPSLILNYFHEKYVQGDDPMTADVTEPVVPFTLAVMVSNGAYGVARQLKITSAQPEIIENEKGLLVSFKIIGAQLGTDPVTPSLSINFGDIDSFETKTARWLLTSSLRGTFYNFTATFENINPLGDPQLSIMEHLGYHELIHLVRLESTDDELDDFLVNDVVDEEEMADAVYDSSNGFFSAPVVSSTITKFSLKKTDIIGGRTYSHIALIVTATSKEASTYLYTRLINNLTRDTISESLLQVTRDDDKQILVGNNAWQTNYYHDSFYLHIFDFVSNMNVSVSVAYSLVFGPRNMYSPVFTKDVYEIDLSESQTPGHIYYIGATDKDPNSKLTYLLHKSTVLSINENTGELRSTESLDTGVYHFFVTVSDDGIPSRNSSTKIVLTITDGIKPKTTSMTTSVVTFPSTTSESDVSSSVISSSTSPSPTVSSTLDSITTSSSSSTDSVSTSSSATDRVVSSSTVSTSSSSVPATDSSSTLRPSEGPDSTKTSPPPTTPTQPSPPTTTSTQSGSTVDISEAGNITPVIYTLLGLTGVALVMTTP